MLDPLGNGLFDIPDYEHIEDERFPPLPPPHSPGQGGDEAEADPFANGQEDGEISQLAEVPAAKKRGAKRPQPKLDSQRLISERGLPALRTLFDDVQFRGKGHEAEDLRLLMHKMENWAHRLYPKLPFDDFIDKVEKLGAKKDVQTCLKRIRLDMPLTHDDFIGKDDEETAPREEPVLGDPDPFEDVGFPDEPLPLVHSTPAPASAAPSLTEEQRRRIELNKQLALERRLARTQQHTDPSGSQPVSSTLSVDEPSSSSSSQSLSQLKDQDEEREDEDPDQSSGTVEQLKDKAPHKDPPLSSQSLSQLKDQDEEREDEDPDQSSDAAEQLKDKAPHKDLPLSSQSLSQLKDQDEEREDEDPDQSSDAAEQLKDKAPHKDLPLSSQSLSQLKDQDEEREDLDQSSDAAEQLKDKAPHKDLPLSSQSLGQLKDQDEEREDLDQSSGAVEQLEDKAPLKDPLLSQDTPLCEKGEGSCSSAGPKLSNSCEDSD